MLSKKRKILNFSFLHWKKFGWKKTCGLRSSLVVKKPYCLCRCVTSLYRPASLGYTIHIGCQNWEQPTELNLPLPKEDYFLRGNSKIPCLPVHLSLGCSDRKKTRKKFVTLPEWSSSPVTHHRHDLNLNFRLSEGVQTISRSVSSHATIPSASFHPASTTNLQHDNDEFGGRCRSDADADANVDAADRRKTSWSKVVNFFRSNVPIWKLRRSNYENVAGAQSGWAGCMNYYDKHFGTTAGTRRIHISLNLQLIGKSLPVLFLNPRVKRRSFRHFIGHST